MKEIPLTQGKIALVDDEDFDDLDQYKWQAALMQGSFYVVRSVYLGKDVFTNKRKYKTLRMSREIMNCPDDKIVDHRNHDTLDHRRYNLRVCTHSQNTANSKIGEEYKGVNQQGTRWRARIREHGKRRHLGSFVTKEAAARAYDEAALRVFGEFATLNFS